MSYKNLNDYKVNVCIRIMKSQSRSLSRYRQLLMKVCLHLNVEMDGKQTLLNELINTDRHIYIITAIKWIVSRFWGCWPTVGSEDKSFGVNETQTESMGVALCWSASKGLLIFTFVSLPSSVGTIAPPGSRHQRSPLSSSRATEVSGSRHVGMWGSKGVSHTTPSTLT